MDVVVVVVVVFDMSVAGLSSHKRGYVGWLLSPVPLSKSSIGR